MKRGSTNEVFVQTILEIFRTKYKGKGNAVKTENILFGLKASGSIDISPQTFRDVIGHIRNHDLLAPSYIVSNVNIGYWCTADKNELNQFLDQELNRMSNQFDNVSSLHKRLRLGQGKQPKTQGSLF